jgi:hypothetical protein
VGYLEDPETEFRTVQAFQNRKKRSEWVARSIPRARVAHLNDAAERFPFLTADAAMGTARMPGPLAAETFAMLGELSTRRWMRDHPSGVAYGQRLATPQMRRSRRKTGILEQVGGLFTEARQEREATELAALPAPVRKNMDDALAAAEQAGIIDENGVLREPEQRHGARARPLFTAVQQAFQAAGRDLTYINVQGQPIKRWGKYSSSHSSAEEAAAAGEPFEAHEAGEEQILNYDPETDPVRVALRERRTRTAGPTGFAAPAQALFKTLDLPVQELQGQIRNLYGWAHGKDVDWTQPQSDLLIELQTGLDSGSGYFVDPESDVAKERHRREAERGQINGHNVTLGRWVADAAPFAADSKPWMMMSGLVDLGVQAADPSAAILGKAGKLGRGRALFANPELYEKAGLWSGVRRSIAGPDALKFLDSKDGGRATEWLTNHTSPYEVWRGLNRKVNLDLATELADTRSLSETREILQRTLGPYIREVSTVKNLGDPLANARAGLTDAARKGRPVEMPIRGPIDAADKDVVGHEIESWLYNVKGMEDETVERTVSRVARATNTPELNAAIRDALRDANGILAKEGITDSVLRSELVRLHEQAYDEGSKRWIDVVTQQNQSDDIVNVGGEEVWDASAHLYLEHAPRRLTLPDARRIRRVQSRYRHLLTPQTGERAGQLRLPLAAIEAIQGEIWKPIALATRIAWPVRVIGEEQIRMAVAGYDSMFNHPISYMSWMIGRKPAPMPKGLAGKIKAPFSTTKAAVSRPVHAVMKPRGTTGREVEEGVFEVLAESRQAKEAAGQVHGGWIERAARTGHRRTYRKSPHEMKPYKRALAAEIVKLANDPVAQRVARTESLEDVKTWFTRGGGNEFRGPLAQMQRGKFDTIEQADSYIESVARRINQNTGGNPELLDAVRTGKFRGRNIIDGDAHLDRDFLKDLDGLIDEFGPDQIIGDEFLGYGEKGLAGLVQTWDRAVDKMFGWLMGERTANLSRNPVFDQAYWREKERLFPFADKATQQQIIREAKAARLTGSRVREAADVIPGIESAPVTRMERITTSGDLTADEVDLLAKGHGLDKTKELLYDLSRRGRTMDAMRVVFPFGEAWSEVITRWFGTGRGAQPLGLVWQNPKTIRRFQQLLQGARGEELGEFMGAPDGQGFFWENQWGEQVFMWPGTAALTDKLLGVEAPLTGRVQGLSMFGTVMPGLGPVAQMPVGWLLQNKPGPEPLKKAMAEALGFKLGPFGTVQEQVLPFGSVGAEDQAAVFSAWNYAPPWAKAAFQAFSGGDLNGKQWNQAVMEVAGSLKATGDYGDSIGEQNRLFEDAADKARWLYAIKALAGTTAPAAPDIEWMLEDNNGQAVRAAALSDELQEMREEDFDTADARFLEKYGPDLMAVLSTPMTTSSIYNVPSTRDGVAWVMANPGIEDKLPNVYGFFAPEGGEEDFSIYNAQFRKGAAIRLDPQDWIRLLNHTKGNVEYARHVEEVGDQENTKAGRAYLDMKREEIYDRYPGWRDEKGKLNKAPDRTLIDELYRAARDPATRDTDAGQGLADYLAARDEVAAYADSQGLAWPGTSKAMLPGRLYLDQRAREIIAEHPQFKRVYDFLLSRETEELEEVTGG